MTHALIIMAGCWMLAHHGSWLLLQSLRNSGTNKTGPSYGAVQDSYYYFKTTTDKMLPIAIATPPHVLLSLLVA
jgi:hypothetical protein